MKKINNNAAAIATTQEAIKELGFSKHAKGNELLLWANDRVFFNSKKDNWFPYVELFKDQTEKTNVCAEIDGEVYWINIPNNFLKSLENKGIIKVIEVIAPYNLTDSKHIIREAVENKTARILSIDLATELKGKKIATIYFGYRGQDGVDKFIIGDIVDDYKDHNGLIVKTIMTSDGRNTYIRSHKENNGVFTCSDSDRFVYFIEVE